MPALHVRYFEAKDGTLYIPPDESISCPKHCIEREANTLREVDILQQRLESATRAQAERDGEREDRAWRQRRGEIRSRIYERIASAATSEYEKEFLRCWIQVSDEKKREYYTRAYEHRRIVVEAREFDRPQTAEEVMKESM